MKAEERREQIKKMLDTSFLSERAVEMNSASTLVLVSYKNFSKWPKEWLSERVGVFDGILAQD
jgi:hypothetical protein